MLILCHHVHINPVRGHRGQAFSLTMERDVVSGFPASLLRHYSSLVVIRFNSRRSVRDVKVNVRTYCC